MAISSVYLTIVSDTPVAVNTASPSGARLVVRNTGGTNTIYIGDASVSSTSGLPLKAALGDPPLVLDLDSGDVLYAACASGLNSTLSVVRL